MCQKPPVGGSPTAGPGKLARAPWSTSLPWRFEFAFELRAPAFVLILPDSGQLLSLPEITWRL